MLVDGTGLVFGTVGGGKVENQAIGLAQEMLRERVAPTGRLVEWNLRRDVGMTGGGVVKLYFEAYNHRPLADRSIRRRACCTGLVRCLLELECRVVCVDLHPIG